MLFAASALTTLSATSFFRKIRATAGATDTSTPPGWRFPCWRRLRSIGPQDCAYRPIRTRPAGTFEDQATKSYVAACILLTVVFGGGARWQMQAFMAEDLNQLPHYKGTERRVVIIEP